MFPNRRRCLAALALGWATALLSCDTQGPPGPPTNIEVVSGEAQSGIAGEELSEALRVRVTDAEDDPVPGQSVTFVVVEGGGSLFVGSAVTGADGTAATRWTLGPSAAAEQRTEARIVASNTGTPLAAVFTATATHGPAAKLTKVAGDNQTGSPGASLTDSIAVRVGDRFDNPVPGASVSWAAGSGSGSVSAASSMSNANGIARARWTVGTTSGTQTASASIDTVTPPVFSAMVSAGAASELIIQTHAAGGVVGLPFGTQPVLRIADARGNVVTSATDAVTVTASSGVSIAGQQTVNAANGVATYSGIGLNGPAGTYTLTYATTIGGVASTAQQEIQFAPGAPAKYVVTTSGSVAVTGTVTVNAQLTDVGGTPLAGAGHTVAWDRSGSPGTFSQATSQTDATGLATATWTPNTESGLRTLTATDEASRAGSVQVDVAVGPATKLAYVDAPDALEWKRVRAPGIQVAVQDQYSNLVTSSAAPVALDLLTNPTGAGVSGAGPVAAVNGVATFNQFYIDKPGSGYQLRASSAGLQPVSTGSTTVSAEAVVAIAPAGTPKGLTVVGSTVYFTTTAALYNAPVTGGVAVASPATPPSGDGPFLTSDAGRFLTTTSLVVTVGSGCCSEASKSWTSLGFAPGGGAVASIGPSVKGYAGDLVSDGTYLFAAFGNTTLGGSVGLRRIRISDGDTLTLYMKTHGSRRVNAPLIALLEGEIYYTALDPNADFPDYSQPVYYNRIEKVSINGGAATTVATFPQTLLSSDWGQMVVTGGRLYWFAEGSIHSASTAGGTVDTHVSVAAARCMVTDGTHLYLSNGSSVMRYALSDFSAVQLVQLDGAKCVAIDDEAIYWTMDDEVRAVKKRPKAP